MRTSDDLVRTLSQRLPACAGILAVCVIVALPFLSWYSFVGMRGLINDPERWVPEDSPERATYEWFLQNFETTDIMLVSWDGCHVGDPRLTDFATAITSGPQGQGTRELVDQVLTAESVLTELTSPSLDLPSDVAAQRLRGSLIGPDGETTCAIVVLTEAGIWRRAEVVEVVEEVLSNVCHLKRDEVYLGGPPIEGEVIDRATRTASNRLTAWSVLVSLLVAYAFLRSLKFVGIVILVGVLGQGLSLSLVPLLGHSMNAVLIVMPPLLFVLLTSMGVHLVNYYWDAVREGHARTAWLLALLRGWQPCLLAVMTTALGLLSLRVSSTIPVKVFGSIAALSLVICSLVLGILLIGAMQRWPERTNGSRRPDQPTTRKPAHFWNLWSAFVTRTWQPICVVSSLAFLAGLWGLTDIETSVRLPELFPADSRIMSDYRWLEENLGPLVPIEVVLSFDDTCLLRDVDELLLTQNLQRELAEMESLDGTSSAATWLPQLPQGGNFGGVMRRALFNRELRERTQELVEHRYLSLNEGRHWRVSARAWALQPLDYGHLIAEVRQRAQQVIARRHAEFPGIHVTVTGVIPFVYRVQRELLHDLLVSFSMAFALIAIVLALFIRGVFGGALAMIPNLFPTIAIFGTLGWLGIPLDIGSIMTASVALGIAVDDTVHFLTWFRRGLAEGRTRAEAIRFSFQNCGNAMVQTSVICGLGLFVYVFSDFVPASRFAWMMVALLAATLVGDLVLLPALLASPAGRVFQPRAHRTEVGT